MNRRYYCFINFAQLFSSYTIIAGFPTRNAFEVASEMVMEVRRQIAWPDSAIVQKMLEIKKTIMMKE